MLEQAKMESRRMIKVHPHPRNSDTNHSSMFEDGGITGYGSMIPRNPSIHKSVIAAENSRLNKDLLPAMSSHDIVSNSQHNRAQSQIHIGHLNKDDSGVNIRMEKVKSHASFGIDGTKEIHSSSI